MKTHWPLSHTKWFEHLPSAVPTRSRKENGILPALPTAAARTTSLTFSMAQPSKAKSSKKIAPVLSQSDADTTPATVIPLQLPPFNLRRERAATLLPSLPFTRPTNFVSVHTEPTIRRSGRCAASLAVDTKRPMPQAVPLLITMPPRTPNLTRHAPVEGAVTQRSVTEHSIVDSSLLKRHSFGSSLMNDNHHYSSGVGENSTEVKSELKNEPSIVKALSVESLTASESSPIPSRCVPIIDHYQMLARDDLFEDSQTFSAGTIKRSQSSAVASSAGERVQTGPSSTDPPAYIPKTPSVQSMDELRSPSRHSMASLAASCHSGDSLRPANDEECYATLPRGSSTEQVNNHVQHDLRIIINGYLRPMASSIGPNPPTKSHTRSKRASISTEETQLIIEDITDKLLSSIDYPIYSQHQRCC